MGNGAFGIPPGFSDSQKPAPSRYGDFLIWKQIIDLAKAEKKSVIFVTDDAKDDWWFKVNNRTFGPRPELVQEFFQEAATQFYMYPSDRFMEIAQQNLEIKQTKAAVKEIREVREQSFPEQIDRQALAFERPIHNPLDELREMERQRREALDALRHNPLDELRETERRWQAALEAARYSPLDELREMERQRREALDALRHNPLDELRETERQQRAALEAASTAPPPTKQSDPPPTTAPD
jgi:hypothetical protein